MTDQPGPVAPQPVYIVAAPSNGLATASLVLGIVGFVLMGIPLIGWFFGGIPDLLAIGFGIAGWNIGKKSGVGTTAASFGAGLGLLSLLTLPFGAGIVW